MRKVYKIAASVFVVALAGWTGAALQNVGEVRHAGDPIAVIGIVECDKYAGTIVVDKAGRTHGATAAEMPPQKVSEIAKQVGPDHSVLVKDCSGVPGTAT